MEHGGTALGNKDSQIRLLNQTLKPQTIVMIGKANPTETQY